MATKAKERKEAMELSYEEMDIVFAALEKFGKEGESIMDRAVKLKSEDAAMAQLKFNKKLEDLRSKFLHE